MQKQLNMLFFSFRKTGKLRDFLFSDLLDIVFCVWHIVAANIKYKNGVKPISDKL